MTRCRLYYHTSYRLLAYKAMQHVYHQAIIVPEIPSLFQAVAAAGSHVGLPPAVPKSEAPALRDGAGQAGLPVYAEDPLRKDWYMSEGHR